VGISTGVIDLQNGGSQSVVRFYCEASNAHYAQIQAPAHGSFSGNVTLTLPATTDTIAGIAATQTFTNKTLTSPKINEDVAVTTTATEINLIDGGTSRGTTAVASGDGILINDAGTMRMTNVDTVSTYFSGHSVGGGNIVTTGALNSGSITSGFGAINNGASNITTTGVGAFGSLDISGDIDVDGTTNLDAVDIDGAVQLDATFTVGANDQGYDVTLHGDTAARNVVWDSSADSLIFSDNAKAVFGAGSDLQIYHDGSNSFISDQGTGQLTLLGSNAIALNNAANTENMLVAFENGSVDLYYDNSKKLATTNTGVEITGSLKPLTYQETYVAKSAASTVTCDLATGTSFSVTMDQNTTFAFTNPPGSGTAFSFTLFVTQHSTAVTLTWPNTVDWAGGSAPDAAGNNEVQAYAFFTRDGGTTYYGFLGGTAIA
jgi:hypothetical protein